MTRLPLSLCIITLNEEANLRGCLASVPFASDIVVLDSGSSDGTRALAETLGARVFLEEWKGFGPQKQRAIELAHYDWVLCLDADEALSPELQTEIVQEWSRTGGFSQSGYQIPRRSYYLGRWIGHGGWYPDYQTRLFNRQKLRWSRDSLHESVQGEGVGSLHADLHHFPFVDLADQVATNNRYSSLGADRVLATGIKIQIGHHLIIKPFVKFLELYFFKQGFRDGVPGYLIALGGAYSTFLKFAKAWEKQNR